MALKPDSQITIVITGDPVAGFLFYSPFASIKEAREWAATAFDKTKWWCAPINSVA